MRKAVLIAALEVVAEMINENLDAGEPSGRQKHRDLNEFYTKLSFKLERMNEGE